MKTPIHYILLLLACVSLTACIYEFPPVDDGTIDSEENPFADGYSLSFTVTLDALGGDAATRVSPESINNWENYVDPQKFRILFFAGEEKNAATGEWDEVDNGAFLFESRTRFIKELTPVNGNSIWRVSVPLFAYGNGAHYGWHWEEIREYLRDHSFKIAVLANRPELEWSMRVLGKDANKNDNPDDIIVAGTWYDNSAPHWDEKNTLFECLKNDGTIDVDNLYLKRIFDLHHSQYDPIYYGKNFSVDYNDGKTGPENHTNNEIYDFITTFPEGKDRPYLSSTSSWVSWAGYDGAIYEDPGTYGYDTGETWNFSESIWKDFINFIDNGGKGTKGFDPFTLNGLTISTQGGGTVMATASKNGFDNNDNLNEKGKRMLSFSFDLPAGTWSVSTKVAVKSPNTSWQLVLEDKDGKPLTKKTISNTSAKEVTLDEVTIDKQTTVCLYAVGRTEFYSIRYSLGESMNNKDPEWKKYRRAIHPSRNYPIPMYGIQKFNAIEGDEIWDWGSPYALDKQLMLLRSAVRLDLVIPKSLGEVKFLLLWYSNVFARCEPMNIWDPTDKLWEAQHNDVYETKFPLECKDAENIIAYGPISRSMDDENSTTVGDYQRRMSWLYGVWMKKAGWDWNGENLEHKHNWTPCTDFRETVQPTEYPQIFNPCVQRNTAVYCGTDLCYEEGDNYHYVVYTGERNINDPSNLLIMGATGSGMATVASWMVCIGNTVYGIPLADFSGNYQYSPITHKTYVSGQPSYSDYGMSAGTSEYYINRVKGGKNQTYERAVQTWDADYTPMPMPLIRNHKYVFTLKGANAATRSDGGSGITVMTEDRYSRPALSGSASSME